MQINSINNFYYQQKTSNKKYQEKRAYSQSNPQVNFKGVKGFAIGALTGGLIASLFTDLVLVYSGLGGLIGDWLEEKHNNKNDDNNMNNQNNLRMYR